MVYLLLLISGGGVACAKGRLLDLDELSAY